MKASTKEWFEVLSKNLKVFIETVKTKKSTLMATDKWAVKDNFCHIVYWHERYAENYQSLANHEDPVVPTPPLYKLNTEGVTSLRKFSFDELHKKLETAHNTLYECIVIKKVPEMTYSRGGRVYKTPDFLDMIAKHIATHTRYIRRAK